jgi:tricorn protease
MNQNQSNTMKKTLPFFITMLFMVSLSAQISGKLMQHPDVSDTHITFTYGDDVWIVSKSGGLANRLSSPPGAEGFPRFSPDGKMIAYTANYNGTAAYQND